MDRLKMKRLRDHLLCGHSTTSVNRLFRMAEGWASFEAFLQVSKGDLLKRWRTLVPDSNRNLGKEFYATFDDAVAWYASPEAEVKPSEAPDPVFSKDQLKRVLDFMELFEKPNIRLSEMQDLLTMVQGVKK